MNSISVFRFLLVSAGSMMTMPVGGHPEIGSLMVKTPRTVGDSDRICSAMAKGEIFLKYFEGFGGFKTRADRSDARKTLENVLRTVAELDLKFAAELEPNVRSLLQMYNVLAVKCLNFPRLDGRPQMDDVQIYHDAFSVFGFLDVTDESVKTDFDNAILYAYAQLDKRSLIARVSRYETMRDVPTGSDEDDTICIFETLKETLKHFTHPFVQRYRLAWLNAYEFGRMVNDIQFPELTKEMEPYYAELMNQMQCKIWVNRI